MSPTRPSIHRARSLVLPLALLMLAACAAPMRTYDGPARPRTDVARIIEVSSWDGGFLSGDGSVARVTALDGVPLAEHSGTDVELLPGRHTLRVEGRVSLAGMTYPPISGTFDIDAAPGATYELWLGMGAQTAPYISLQDAATHAVLGSTETSQ